MAQLTKQALIVENNTNFPNNNSGYITPALLREFNSDMIDSTVNQTVYTTDSASWNSDVDSLQAQINALDPSGSANSVAALNAYTSSNNIKWNTLGGQSGSWVTETESGSFLVTASVSLNTITFTKGDASTFDITVNTGSGVTSAVTASSLVTASAVGNTITFTKGDATTFDVSVSSTPFSTASLATTGSNTFNGNQTINGNLNLTGSLTASGLIYPLTDNGAKSFIQTDGAGNLSLQYVNSILEEVRYGENITLGDPLYVSGSNGTRPVVWKAQAADTTKMPVIYVATSTAVANTNTSALALGDIQGVTTTGYPAGTLIYVGESGGWTATRPSGSASIIQPLGIVTKEGAGGSGRGLVLNPGPVLLPNIQTGYLWVGDGGNQPVAIATSSFLNENETGSLVTTASFNAFTSSINAFTASENTKNTTLANVTASLNSYTASNDTKWTTLLNVTSSLIARTGSYATTGSNTFLGDQTFTDAAGNAASLVEVSSSLMLVAKGFTSASAHISSSVGSGSNFIFKYNTATPDTIVSGSGNIFPNFNAPTTGFKRYVGGNGNIFTNPAGPLISGSMGFPVNMNRNIGDNVFTLRGPVSSSAWTMNSNVCLGGSINIGTSATNNAQGLVSGLGFTTNVFNGGTINLIANKTNLPVTSTITSNLIFGATLNFNLNSASINYNSNIQNGGITINNNYVPTTGATSSAAQVHGLINTVYGVNHALNSAGTNATTAAFRTLYASFLAGSNISASIESNSTDSGSLAAVGLLGNGLIISGSSTSPTALPMANFDGTHGTFIVGRYNSETGNRAKSAETVLAVGTGTGYGNRKTGFLIDSGSNAFVEGSLNVSGSTAFTGSAPSILSGSFSGSIITNLTDTYTDVAAVQQIVSISSGSYAGLVSGSLTNTNTLYIIV